MYKHPLLRYIFLQLVEMLPLCLSIFTWFCVLLYNLRIWVSKRMSSFKRMVSLTIAIIVPVK